MPSEAFPSYHSLQEFCHLVQGSLEEPLRWPASGEYALIPDEDLVPETLEDLGVHREEIEPYGKTYEAFIVDREAAEKVLKDVGFTHFELEGLPREITREISDMEIDGYQSIRKDLLNDQ